ncbi:MAG: hypothetical protein AB7O48_14555 [Cyclobacteriaceae bacterium]
MYHLRYLVVYFFLIAGFNSIAQVIGLVLEADGCSIKQRKLERFSQVHPGDSITVKGSLVLITNYYQVFEIDSDSIFVFPQIVEGFKETPVFPDLEKILGASAFSKDKPVSHGYETLELVWPPARWTYMANEPICVMWHPLRESGQFKVEVFDLYDEELYTTTVHSGARFKMLNAITEVDQTFQEQGFVMVSVTDSAHSPVASGIFYCEQEGYNRINPCEVSTAAQAVLAAIGLETYGAPASVTRAFYKRALALSDHEVYQILSMAFDRRNGDDK